MALCFASPPPCRFLHSFLSKFQILEELKHYALNRAGVSVEELKAMMNERIEARKEKNFERSDAIRAELALRGVMLMDGGDGTEWKPTPLINEEEDE